MLAGKVKDYKGPKTHSAIIKQIQKDLRKHKSNSLSFYHIERIVKLFFLPTGIGYYFRYKRNCYIKDFGYFKLAHKYHVQRSMKKKKARIKRNKYINDFHQRKIVEAREKAKKDLSL